MSTNHFDLKLRTLDCRLRVRDLKIRVTEDTNREPYKKGGNSKDIQVKYNEIQVKKIL